MSESKDETGKMMTDASPSAGSSALQSDASPGAGFSALQSEPTGGVFGLPTFDAFGHTPRNREETMWNPWNEPVPKKHFNWKMSSLYSPTDIHSPTSYKTNKIMWKIDTHDSSSLFDDFGKRRAIFVNIED